MTRPRPGIGSELLPVGLILLCLVGTWTLVVAMHRRGAAPRDASASAVPAPPPAAVSAAPAVPPPDEPAPEPPAPPPPPPVTVEDPTEKAIRQLSAAEAEQVRAAQEADQKAVALESARQKVVAEAERYHRRNALVLKQLENLHDQAQKLETELTEVALERDVLAKERDAIKAALAKARTRSSYAVLPHKAQNGTWRRPIIIECKNGQATLQPGGPSFTLLELSMILGPNGSPIVGAVAREAVKAQGLTSPDGAPVVPYIFFVVRPDGIKPYYNARAQLEPLGISFGYELVDQNMEIEFPDLDNIEEWDGSGMPRPSQPDAAPPLARADGNRSWPAPPTGGSGHGNEDPSNTFVWPARPGLAAGGPGGGGGGGSGGSGTGEPSAENRGGPGADGSIGRGSGGGGGVLDFPRGGRPGLGARDAATARGPYGARDGLGQGGSGVDLVPQGTPGLDPSNPYDASGPVGSVPPRTRSGGPPPMGGYGTGAGAGAPAGAGTETGPRLIPVSPDGMPGLEAPNASKARGTSNTAGGDPTRRGGWIVSTRDLGPTPDPTGGQPGAGGNTPSADTDPSATPFPVPAAGPSVASSGAGTPPGIVPAPPAGSTGAASTTSSSSSTPSSSTTAATTARAPAASNLGNLAAGRPYSPAAAAGGRFAPDQGTQPATATNESVQGGAPPQQQGTPGTANSNLGAPPPLSQLARLAGTASPDGAPGQPSKLASASPFGIPLPMPPAGSNGDDDSDPSQQKGEKGAMPRGPRSRLDRRKPMSIDVPFEMVVACAPDGVVIHPGGYRLSAKALKSQDGLLLQNLKTIVQTRRQVDPMIHPKPSIRFLVEPGGSETYRDARKQTFLSGLDWPVSLQVSDSDILDNVAPRESF